MGKRRTPTERAIIYCAALADLTLTEANELLAVANFHPVPGSSYVMVKKKYVPYFHKSAANLKECIYHPKPVGGL